MKFYDYPTTLQGRPFALDCVALLERMGLSRVAPPAAADVAIAPLLTRRLRPEEYNAPRLGTLVFHPSALPFRRGPDAIRHAVYAGDRVSASTWFWCAKGWDAGDVCEQEVVVLAPGESPGRAYHTRFVPAALRALERAIAGCLAGSPRRVPQDETTATYDPRFELCVECRRLYRSGVGLCGSCGKAGPICWSCVDRAHRFCMPSGEAPGVP